MRVILTKSSTGLAHFPGLAKPVILESSALSNEDASELKRLVEAADFFSSASGPAPSASPGAADYQSQTLTVEHGTQRHTVHLSDLHAKAPGLRPLIQFVERKARDLTRASPQNAR